MTAQDGIPGTASLFRYAVVEDEALARRVLVRALARLAPEALLAWEAEDGDQALHRMAECPVDVLFLDIVFPPEGAFGMLERLRARGQRLPQIVFVTSREDQALRAFEWAACDYLVKPLSLPRVRETLDRLRLSRGGAELEEVLRAVKGLTHRTGAERFTVSVKDRILVFRWREVLYLHTEFRQVYAHTARGKVPLDQGMDDLEALLGDRFVRIHRSSLVNLDALLEVHNPSNRAGEAVLRDGARLSVSRARMEEVLRRLQRLS